MTRILVMIQLFALAFGGGCATVESTFKASGIKTAAFDLQCSEEQIEMTVLNRNDGLGCFGSQVGVRGCGKQTTYECDNSRQWRRSAEISTLESK